MIEAVKVIAPMNAPINNSIFCAPECSWAGLNTAAIAISTADRPTKECIRATSSGILVIWTRFAAIEPMMAPATIATPISQQTGLKLGIKNVVMTAKAIPIMPQVLPWREVVGEDKPFRAKIKSTEETR